MLKTDANKYKTFAKCLVGMYFFSDPFWTINVQNISMCNAAVNAFWSSARIDAEKKEKKSKMRLRPPLQFTNFFNDTVYQNRDIYSITGEFFWERCKVSSSKS